VIYKFNLESNWHFRCWAHSHSTSHQLPTLWTGPEPRTTTMLHRQSRM